MPVAPRQTYLLNGRAAAILFSLKLNTEELIIMQISQNTIQVNFLGEISYTYKCNKLCFISVCL